MNETSSNSYYSRFAAEFLLPPLIVEERWGMHHRYGLRYDLQAMLTHRRAPWRLLFVALLAAIALCVGCRASSARGLACDVAGVAGLGVTVLSVVGRGVGDPTDSCPLPGGATSEEAWQPTPKATAASKATKRSRQGTLLSVNIACRS